MSLGRTAKRKSRSLARVAKCETNGDPRLHPPDMMAAFVANEAFQKAEGVGRHIRTKIVTLKDLLEVGQSVQPAHLAESK
jgi:hypothetical protein